MKNYLIYLSLMLFFTSSNVVLAEESGKDFESRKAEAIDSLKEQKAVLDKVINCISAANSPESAKKCREIKKAGMQEIRDRRFEKRKSHLQNQLNKLEEKRNKNRDSE